MPLETALVRVWRDDAPMGAGFLAGPTHLLTAAHVVADALGATADEQAPIGATVSVDFPMLAPGQRLRAEVTAWRPPVPGQGTDIAGLLMRDPLPDGARPLVLSRRRPGLDGSLVMVGFPRGLEHGEWVHGRPGGPVATGWVEIESDPARQAMITPGFSGAPVWSMEADAAVGMVGYKVSGAGTKIGYMMPVNLLLAAWPELAGIIEQRVPFQALRTFSEQDADLFYGRDELVTVLTDRIGAQVPLIGVIGSSGVGKSSLWHAGVVPRLRDGSATGSTPLIATIRPSDGRTPLNALAFTLDTLLAPDREVVARVDAVTELAERLACGAMPEVVAAVLDCRAADRLVVCVDQFEEVLAANEGERAAFTDALCACLATGSRLSVLVNVRDTFLGAMLRDQTVAELTRRWLPVTVGEMTDSELRSVMTRPLEKIGTVSFANGLVERILQDLRRTPSPLPLLEFTLAELWARRRSGFLTHEAYELLGGVSQALADYADRIWAGLDPATKTTAERLLVQLARPLSGDELTVRRTALRDECDDAQWAAAQRLASTRLLVLHEVSAGHAAHKLVPGVELAHDSLLTQWARLRELTEQFRDFRLWQEELRRRMAIWSDSELSGSRLLSGADLRDGRRWAASHGELLTERERDYLSQSVRHRRRFITRITAAVAVLVVIASVTSTAIYEHRSRQVAETIAKNLNANAGQLSGTDPYGALQLAVRAYRTDPSVGLAGVVPDSVGVVSRLLPDADQDASADSIATKPTTSTETQAGWMATGTQFEIESLMQAASGDGSTLATTDPAFHVVLWHVLGGHVQDEPLTGLDGAGGVVISRSGRYIAFRQSVFPAVNPSDIGGPAGSDGLSQVNPSDYPTCAPQSMTSSAPCLVVYDTEEHRVVFAKQFNALPMVGGGVIMSIDPADEVLGVSVADSSIPIPPEGFRNTLYLFNLRTGMLLRKVRLPWQALMIQLWLGPSGRSAIITDGLLNGDLSLSFLDLRRDTPTRRQLADPAKLSRVTSSLDGRTIAALVDGVHGGRGQLIAWNTATGAVTASIGGLSTAQVSGTLALDATGSTAWLSSQPDIGTMHTTNLLQIGAGVTQHGSVWSLTSGHQIAQFTYPTGWDSIWPLGSGARSPLVLMDGNILGVVTTTAGSAPLAKITAAASTGQSGVAADIASLCSLLGSEVNNQDQETQNKVPSGAYQGQLCP